MKTYIKLSCLSLFFLSACKDPVIKGVTVDTVINLIVRDQNGKNRLDPSTPNYYKPEDIRIFYLKDGQKQEVYNPSLDIPRNFKIIKSETTNEYVFRVFVNEGSVDQEVTTTYIQWRAGAQDTVNSLITRSSSSIYCDKVWFNDTVRYDRLKNPVETVLGDEIFRRLINITQP